MNIYRKDIVKLPAGLAGLVILLLMVAGYGGFAQTPYLRMVRAIETTRVGMANPAGLVFSPLANAFVLAGAVGNANIKTLSLVAEPGDSITMAVAIADPLNMGFDHQGNSLLFFNSAGNQLTEIQAGLTGLPSTSPGAVSHYQTAQFGLQHARGITFDPASGDLYVLELPSVHAMPRIVRIIPDPQMRFDGQAAQQHGRISQILLPALKNLEPRGVAINPANSHLYVYSMVAQTLYELSPGGQVISTRNLSQLNIGTLRGITFTNSGDQTDDPGRLNLYLAVGGLLTEAGEGSIIELSLEEPTPVNLSAITEQSVLIQTIYTSEWSPPSPDPAGIAYLPSSNTLLVSDSEVNEMPALFTGVNVFETTLNNSPVATYSTTAFSNEPTDIAFNPVNQHLFYTDDDEKRVFEINPGLDGDIGTADDIITSFSTKAFDCHDPEGITYDHAQGHLFISDGLNAEIYEVSPGANGLFDGIAPLGDDEVTTFDTAIFGLIDPEGVEFNPDAGTLFIVSRDANMVIEATPQGAAIRALDISFIPGSTFSGVAYAPGSDNPAQKNLYITDRGIDNNEDPNENDGKIYEVLLPPSDPSLPFLTIDDIAVNEGDLGTVEAVFTVSLSAPGSEIVTVDFITSDGTAIAGSDYVATAGQVIFQPGQLSRMITVQIMGDELAEADEAFQVLLSNAEGATLGDGVGTATIIDNDGPQTIFTVSLQDGVDGYTGARDTWLNSSAGNTNYGAATGLEVDGSPATAALFYWDLNSIPPGSAIESASITFDVSNTSAGQSYELYELKRPWTENEATWVMAEAGQGWEVPGANGSGDRGTAVLGSVSNLNKGFYTTPLTAAGVGVVQSWVNNPGVNNGFILLDYLSADNKMVLSSRENNPPTLRPQLTVTYAGGPQQPSLSIHDAVIAEADSGTVDLIFTLSLSFPGSDMVAVDYATVDGSAIAGSDYIPKAGQVVFQPGQVSRPVTVQIKGDLQQEPDESFSVHLSNPGNAVLADDEGIGTIIDNDAPPVADFTGAPLNGPPPLAVNFSNQSNGTISSYQWDFGDGNSSSLANPSHVYAAVGTYTVSLIVSAPTGSDTLTRTDYITAASRVTVSFQEGTDGYSGARDAWLNSTAATNNYGSAAELEIDGSPATAALFYWDLNSIPPGSIIESAALALDVTNNSAGQSYEFYELKRPWVEGEASWSESAVGQSWEVAGANGSGDRGATVLGSIVGVNGINTISLVPEAVAVVQAWVDSPSANYGFILQDYLRADNKMAISSREKSAPAVRPKLTVTYSLPVGAGLLAGVPGTMPEAHAPGNADDPSTARSDELPTEITLGPNYPNPFNPETHIRYSLPAPAQVLLVIYDVSGRRVCTLVDESQPEGYQTILWDGKNDVGSRVSSGIYFYQLRVGRQVWTAKMIMQK